MKKQVIAAAIVLMASSVSSVQAGEVLNADASILPFANSILGKSQRLPGAVSNDQPNVDRSLALFANSILGKSQRLSEATSNDKPNVDASLGLFATSILN